MIFDRLSFNGHEIDSANYKNKILKDLEREIQDIKLKFQQAKNTSNQLERNQITLSNRSAANCGISQANNFSLDPKVIEFVFKKVQRLDLSNCILTMYDKKFSFFNEANHLSELFLGKGCLISKSQTNEKFIMPRVLRIGTLQLSKNDEDLASLTDFSNVEEICFTDAHSQFKLIQQIIPSCTMIKKIELQGGITV